MFCGFMPNVNVPYYFKTGLQMHRLNIKFWALNFYLIVRKPDENFVNISGTTKQTSQIHFRAERIFAKRDSVRNRNPDEPQ